MKIIALRLNLLSNAKKNFFNIHNYKTKIQLSPLFQDSNAICYVHLLPYLEFISLIIFRIDKHSFVL